MSAGLVDLNDAAVLEQIFAPVAASGKLALAVSGGADSLALMLLAARWAHGADVELLVMSLDHGLRPEAAAEVEFVLSAAAGLGLRAQGLRWDGPYPETGVQQAARQARYRLMGEAMAIAGAKWLLTGHHLHDQAETVLMRLAHGSGLDGLRGMERFSRVEGVPIFRPLLAVAPEALRQLVLGRGFTPVADPSNQDSHYERVRWRAMLGQLESLGLTAERLAQLGRRAGEAQDVVVEAADAANVALVTRVEGMMTLSRAGFAQLSPAVATLVLSRLLTECGDGRKWRALGPVEKLRLALIDAAPFRGRTLHGCSVRRTEAMIMVSKEPGRVAKSPMPAAMQPLGTG